MQNNTKEIYLAGGCFWGMEKYLGLLHGVIKTTAGYANGTKENPSYEDVCSEKYGFAEAVHVVYQPAKLPLERLLQFFFAAVDPVAINRQGGDTGLQYRSGIYYSSASDLPVIKAALELLQYSHSEKIAIECLPLENFYPAEEPHQAYLDKNPSGYCHIGPALFKFAQDSQKYTRPPQEELKARLSGLQFDVTQNSATEKPFENEYNNELRQGIYVDITSGEPLFMSSDKFDAGCGWPSFSKPIENSRVNYLPDDTIPNRHRTEVRSQIANSHLGHVFNDGPKEAGGLRYCINGAALRFVAKEDMQKEGYAEWLYLFEK